MEPDRLVVSCFPNAKALPFWVAHELGLFERRNIHLELDQTVSSDAQREGLAEGRIHLVQAAVDNALAMICDGYDVIIVMGGENGMNEFIVQPEIDSFADFMGRTLVVDSPRTGYALQAQRLLSLQGLRAGMDYDIHPFGNSRSRYQALIESRRFGGSVLNPPFSVQARLRGLKSLGALAEHLGPYQAGGAFVLRSWADAFPERLQRYIEVYIQSLRWMSEAENHSQAVGVLRRELSLSENEAAATFEELMNPISGFNPDAALDRAGLGNVIATRAEVEGPSPLLEDVSTFVDERFYQRALAALARAPR